MICSCELQQKQNGGKKCTAVCFELLRRPELLSASQCVITGHWNCSKAVRVRFAALAESQKEGHRLDAATVQMETRGLKRDCRRGSGADASPTPEAHLLPVQIWQVKGTGFPTHWEWSGGRDPRGSPWLSCAATASVFPTRSSSPYTDLCGRRARCSPAHPAQRSYAVPERKAGVQSDRCLHSHRAQGFRPSGNDSGLRVVYGFPGPYVKSEEFRGLGSTLALSAFQERKPGRNCWHGTAPTSQEVGEDVWETKREHSAELKGGNNQ